MFIERDKLFHQPQLTTGIELLVNGTKNGHVHELSIILYVNNINYIGSSCK